MKSTSRKITLVFALSLAGGSAFAEDIVKAPRPVKKDSRVAAKEKMMECYDADKDGRLNEKEVEVIARDRMLRRDINKDGKVDEFELKQEGKGVRKMKKMTALERLIACEQALAAAEAQKVKELLERKPKRPAKK